jgi:hypothetical protein
MIHWSRRSRPHTKPNAGCAQQWLVRAIQVVPCIVLLLGVSCVDEVGGGGRSCNDLASELRQCDLLTSGDFGCGWDDLPTQCAIKCSDDLSCDDLATVTCGDPEQVPVYSTCFDDCAFFHCDNGELILKTQRCDGWIQCDDLSDERGCPGFFECADGSGGVPEEWKCDGLEGCGDGSDEAGCDPIAMFECDVEPPAGDGGITSGSSCASIQRKLTGCGLLSAGEFPCEETTDAYTLCRDGCLLNLQCSELFDTLCGDSFISRSLLDCFDNCAGPAGFECIDKNTGEIRRFPPEFKCDGHVFCEDASDERDCPNTFVCDSDYYTYVIDESQVCDGYPDCYDGSDEASCASLQCGGGGVASGGCVGTGANGEGDACTSSSDCEPGLACFQESNGTTFCVVPCSSDSDCGSGSCVLGIDGT